MEHKTFSVEIKALDYAGRTVEGYAAAFGNIDGVGDIIHRGAFKQTLTDRGHKVKFLWQHDPSEPIGKVLSIAEADQGLAFKAAISDTARGRDALALLKDGAIGEMSIGYDTVKGGSDYSKSQNGETVRNLRALKLYEISLVTFPANEQAIVTGLKGQDVMPSESKPYRNVPDELTDKMDSCVEQVMEKGQDKETAIAICYASVVEGKSLAEAFHLQGLEMPEAKSIGTVAESEIHRMFTNMADEWYGFEKLTRDERILMSNAIGDALAAFVAKLQADAPQLYERQLYPDMENSTKDVKQKFMPDQKGLFYDLRKDDNSGGYIIPIDAMTREQLKIFDPDYHTGRVYKAGRVLSQANVTRIMAAMSALHEALAAAGVNMDGEGEMMPEKSNSDIIESSAETAQPAPANADTQPHNSTTPGPDTTKSAKPASVLLREIDLYLAELDTLEV